MISAVCVGIASISEFQLPQSVEPRQNHLHRVSRALCACWRQTTHIGPISTQVTESEVEAASRGQFRGAGVVLHLYDADSKLGASLDLLLEAKAGSFMGTRWHLLTTG